MKPLLSGAVAGLLTWALCFPLHRLLVQRGIVDRPNARSSHQQPTARGGGIAIITSLLLVTAAGLLGPLSVPLLFVFGGAIFLAVISFIDDVRSLSVRIRFICHVLAAGGVAIAAWGNGFGGPVPLLAVALVPLWVVGHTNAFNFMDGINGLAAVQTAITGIGMALLATDEPGPSGAVLLVSALAGASLGFLPHNFPRARLFLGDVGSAPIGFMLAALVVWMSAGHVGDRLVPLLLFQANFLLDTGITLVRRVARGERWSEAHREHFYQRLVRSGCTHSKVTLTVAALQVPAAALILQYPAAAPVSRAAIALAVIGLWLVFFAGSELRFRATNR